MRRTDLVFFLSGAAALVYQVVWIRLLARLLGSDAGALGIVLATFMAGLGLGAHLFAGAARRARRPARLFLWLELGLGAWAAASPWLLTHLEPLASPAGRALLAAGVLLPPTLAMGATFPLMGRLAIPGMEALGRETSAFYAANTLGAAAGALASAFALMPALGLTGALLAAAGLDVLAGVLAALLLAERPPLAPPGDARPAPRAPLPPHCVGALLLGASGLALEVLLARLLVSVTGASIYAWSIVLGVFLLGIALGSRQLVGPGADGSAKGLRADARTFALAAAALAPLTFAGLLALRWQLGERDLFGSLSNRIPDHGGVATLWASHALFAALALLPPALALGAALPSAAAAHARARAAEGPERPLARVYAWNTAGALGGSLLAAFVLLPRLGPRLGLVAALAPAALAAVLAPGRSGRALAAALGTGVALGLALLPPRGAPADRRVLAYEQGPHAGAAVEERELAPGHVVRSLRVDGKVVATTAPVDLRLQRLLGHVPGVLHGDVRTALVIGLGTGMTAGSLLDLPTVERVDVFEISSAVRAAAREFAPWNGGVVDDPRAHVHLRDGRHALAIAAERWDLITADPIHPWTRGSSDLYSLEHFEQLARHLEEGGVASQWLPLYQLSTEDVRTVVATWCAAFPHVSAWLTAYDLALVGSRAPLPGEARLATLALPPAVRAHLAEAGVRSGPELAALLVADDAALRAFAAGAAPMTDDRPVLEFRAPRSYLGGFSEEALRWAARDEGLSLLPAPARERGREVRAILLRFLDDLPGGMGAANRRYGEALLALPPLE